MHERIYVAVFSYQCIVSDISSASCGFVRSCSEVFRNRRAFMFPYPILERSLTLITIKTGLIVSLHIQYTVRDTHIKQHLSLLVKVLRLAPFK